MRLYTFCNYYLSSIQQGIQSAHVIGEMFAGGVNMNEAALTTLYDWAKNHKTMVVLNGGNSANLAELWYKLSDLSEALYLPFNGFREDAQSLNNALTCVGIIIPEKIYAYNEAERDIAKQNARGGNLSNVHILNPYKLSDTEKKLAETIAAYPLAK